MSMFCRVRIAKIIGNNYICEVRLNIELDESIL